MARKLRKLGVVVAIGQWVKGNFPEPVTDKVPDTWQELATEFTDPEMDPETGFIPTLTDAIAARDQAPN